MLSTFQVVNVHADLHSTSLPLHRSCPRNSSRWTSWRLTMPLSKCRRFFMNTAPGTFTFGRFFLKEMFADL